jgi:hypothetical protein
VTPPGGGGRLARLAIGVIATLVTGSALAACGASANGLAKQACTYVDRSITLMQRASEPDSASDANALRQRAYIELLSAMPIAAQAAYHDSQYQALVTTLSETNRVSEQTLIPSLQAQCRAAQSSVFNQQPPPGTIPPASGS